MTPSARRWLAALAVLAIGLTATGVLSFLIIQSDDRDRRAQVDRAGLLAARQLETLTTPAAQLTDALASYVAARNGELDPAVAEGFMDRLLQESPIVRTLTLAPDNVIGYVAPLEGNEAALGLDLESIPDQWEPIEPLIESRSPGLIGPFDLVQGGKGLAYRVPVFLDDGSYWGLASAVIDADRFFADAMDNAGIPLSSVAMRVTTGTESPGVYTYGNPDVLAQSHQAYEVQPPGDTWQLVLAADRDPHVLAAGVGALGTLLSVALALLTYATIGARQRRDEATERLNDLAALAPGMLFQYRIHPDGSTTLPYVSDRLAEHFSIDPRTVADNADDLWDLVEAEDREAAATTMQAAIADRAQWTHRLRLRDAEGVVRWYRARATPEFTRSGDVLLHGYLADVSAEVEAEERMSIHASVYAATHNGVLILSESGHIVDANEAFTQMTGYEVQELLGHHFRFLGSNLVPDAVYREIRSALARDTYWRGEMTMRHADGVPTDHTMTVLLVRGEGRPSGHIIAIMTPLSELRDDLVTGLPGRLLFGAQLEVLIDQAANTDGSVMLAVIGLDRFSEINSSFGHRIGDLVLREVAQRITEACPDADAVARIGGDEFALVLRGSLSDNEVRSAMDTLSSALANPVDVASGTAPVSASIGIADCPQDGLTSPDLLNAATYAMRAAKAEGGGRYRQYDPEMRQRVERRARVTEALNLALDRGSLAIQFQPIIDLRTGRTIKAEALARLNDPELGPIGPDQFIPLAENSGRIRDIGDVAFAKALALLRQAREIEPAFSAAVNLSPVELRSGPQSQRDRLRLLEDLGLPGQAITVEITEEAALESNEETLLTLDLYREAGVRIAVDDFGTGYSSLSYLQRLRIDYLKIDRAFVSGLELGNDSHTLVLVMIEMARTLGLQTIAEGIETEAQAELLQSAGCDFGQGYLFGAAMSAEAILERLQSQSARSATE